MALNSKVQAAGMKRKEETVLGLETKTGTIE